MVNMLNTVTRKTNGLRCDTTEPLLCTKMDKCKSQHAPKIFYRTRGQHEKSTTSDLVNLGGIILVGAQLLPGGGFNLVWWEICGVGEAVWGLGQNCISWDPIASFSLGVSGNEVQGTRVSLWTILLQKSLQVSNSIVMFGIALLPPHVASSDGRRPVRHQSYKVEMERIFWSGKNICQAMDKKSEIR